MLAERLRQMVTRQPALPIIATPPGRWRRPHALVCALLLAMAGMSAAVSAQTEVKVIGLFREGAVLVIDGGPPRTLKSGQVSREGVRLISADDQQAIVEFGGSRETLILGQSIAARRSDAGRQQAILMSDGRGHFWANAEINGNSARVLVDTGATFISMSSSTARRLGINYLQGQRGFTSTANGTVPVYRVRLASVRIGQITLNNIDASVHEGDGLPVILLGMSFLNRVEMQRDGERMTLIRRF